MKKKELKKAIKPEGSDEDSEGSEAIRVQPGPKKTAVFGNSGNNAVEGSPTSANSRASIAVSEPDQYIDYDDS